MSVDVVTPEIIAAHNLTLGEYDRIRELLGREPNLVELGLFSALWSEHCSYKSSRIHLRRLPTTAPWVIQGPGENAGVIDIGEGIAVVFKIESHNHPSYVEPFQGAATGVGGILRDVFAMGARPIALMDALRFGPLDEPRNRLILRGVVGGIAHYGNCVGVPTVGGDLYFEPCYSTNPLVNVFCLGVARRDELHFARAQQAGRVLLYVGSETGRDGIHGANILASRAFQEQAEEMRPTVQIGDPFMEKILMEACLELMRAGLVEAIQDMGAAGLTSSSVEMAAKGNLGVRLNLDRIPLREEGMTPYEIMLSESQERMLLILKPGVEDRARRILDRWDIPYRVIGELTPGERLELYWKDQKVADIPVRALVQDAPTYQRPEQPYRLASEGKPDWPAPADFQNLIKRWIRSASFASRRWIYRQYDHTVRTNTLRLPGHDAAVLRIKGTRKAVVMTTDGNGRMCYIDPYLGAQMAVAEAARNVVMMGGTPRAVTNCLNFGSPENPPVMYQFARVIDGMARACDRLNTPVVSGNVSFYNETEGRPIYPTPIIGMVGLIQDVQRPMPRSFFVQPGHWIYLVGRITPSLTGSTLARDHGHRVFEPLAFDLEYEARFQAALIDVMARYEIATAHDVSDGGLLWALVEAALSAPDGVGVRVWFEPPDRRLDEWFCSEIASAAVLALDPHIGPRFEREMQHHDIETHRIGEVTAEDTCEILCGRENVLRLKLAAARRAWFRALEQHLQLHSW